MCVTLNRSASAAASVNECRMCQFALGLRKRGLRLGLLDAAYLVLPSSRA